MKSLQITILFIVLFSYQIVCARQNNLPVPSTILPVKISVPRSSGEPHNLSFSPNGKFLAIGTRKGSVLLWESDTGKLMPLGRHKDGFVMHVIFSCDSLRLATGGYDGNVLLWDMKSEKLIANLSGHKSPIGAVTFSPDGTKLLTLGSAKRVYLWNAFNGEKLMSIPERENYYPPHSGGVTGAILGVLTQPYSTNLFSEYEFLTQAQISPDGVTLAITSNESIFLWDASLNLPKSKLGHHDSTIYTSKFSPDGQLIATANRDQTAKLWNAANGRLISTLAGHKEGVVDVSFSPDGKTVATISDDQTAKLWDVGNGQLKATLFALQGSGWELVWSPDGRKIATASYNRKKSVKVWDAVSGKLLATLKDSCSPIAFSAGGQKLATSDSKTDLFLWDESKLDN